jgi:SAM-dependent methyltransferase
MQAKKYAQAAALETVKRKDHILGKRNKLITNNYLNSIIIILIGGNQVKQRELRRAARNLYNTVVKLILLYQPKTVLDLGSGYGNLVQQIKKAGIKNVTASDLDTKQFKIPDISCLKINLNKPIKIPHKYDLITCTEVIEHVHNPYKLLKEIHSLLNPKGILILTTPNNQNIFSRIFYLLFGNFLTFGHSKANKTHISPIFLWQMKLLIDGRYQIEKITYNRSVIPLIKVNIPLKKLILGQNIVYVLRKI